MSRPARSADVRLLIGAAVAAVALVPLSPASAAAALVDGPVHASRALAGCVGNPIDVNADGFDDAVVGNPYATVSGHREAGSVMVLFGDADGRIGEGGRRVLTQASFGGSTAPCARWPSARPVRTSAPSPTLAW